MYHLFMLRLLHFYHYVNSNIIIYQICRYFAILIKIINQNLYLIFNQLYNYIYIHHITYNHLNTHYLKLFVVI